MTHCAGLIVCCSMDFRVLLDVSGFVLARGHENIRRLHVGTLVNATNRNFPHCNLASAPGGDKHPLPRTVTGQARVPRPCLAAARPAPGGTMPAASAGLRRAAGPKPAGAPFRVSSMAEPPALPGVRPIRPRSAW